MKASIILAARNAEATIERALQSVVQQSLASFEIIVVNDGSEDGTEALLQNASRADPRIRLLAHPHSRGVSAARNSAIAMAKGDWIAILDADDAFEPERLERLTSFGEKFDLDVVIDNLRMIDATNGHFLGVAFPSEWMRTEADLPPSFLIQHDIPFSQDFGLGYCKPIFRRSSFLTLVGRYNEELACAEDVLALQTALLRGARARMFDAAGYRYSVSPNSHSHRPGANVDISRANRVMTNLSRDLCPSLVPLMMDRQRIIDYTSLLSARARNRPHDARYFFAALPKRVIVKQAIRLASKRLGFDLPTWDPRHIRTVPNNEEQRLSQPRS